MNGGAIRCNGALPAARSGDGAARFVHSQNGASAHTGTEETPMMRNYRWFALMVCRLCRSWRGARESVLRGPSVVLAWNETCSTVHVVPLPRPAASATYAGLCSWPRAWSLRLLDGAFREVVRHDGDELVRAYKPRAVYAT